MTSSQFASSLDQKNRTSQMFFGGWAWLALILLLSLVGLLLWQMVRLGRTEHRIATLASDIEGLTVQQFGSSISGARGEQGLQGTQGLLGPQGGQSTNGADGATGPQGATGATGPQGPQGSEGPEGPEGPAGSSDINSINAGSGLSNSGTLSDQILGINDNASNGLSITSDVLGINDTGSNGLTLAGDILTVSTGNGLDLTGDTIVAVAADSTVSVGASGISVNVIGDSNIAFGTGAGQVSAADLPIADGGVYFSAGDVEGALQEVGASFASLSSFVPGSVIFAGGTGSLSEDNGGLFFDNSTNRLFMDSISIPTTDSASAGVIYKESDRFIHNFALSGTTGLNTFVGLNAGNFAMTGSTGAQGSYNTGIGEQALQTNTIGQGNTATGAQALVSNTSGDENTGIGLVSLYNNTTGYGNTALGTYTLSSNSTGSYNVALGLHALTVSTGTRNTAIGAYALGANTSADENIAIGPYALTANTTGTRNLAIGVYAAMDSTTANGNIAVGHEALRLATTGSNNLAIGSQALFELTEGSGNVAVGQGAGDKITIATNNTFVGTEAGFFTTTGSANTHVGFEAGQWMITGDGNTSLGNGALYGPDSDTVSGTGSNNTAVGIAAGGGATNPVTSSTSLTFLGANAGLGSTTQRTDSTAIGADAKIDADHLVVLGGPAVTDVFLGTDKQATGWAANMTLDDTGILAWTDRSTLTSPADGGILLEKTDGTDTLRFDVAGNALEIAPTAAGVGGTATLRFGDPAWGIVGYPGGNMLYPVYGDTIHLGREDIPWKDLYVGGAGVIFSPGGAGADVALTRAVANTITVTNGSTGRGQIDTNLYTIAGITASTTQTQGQGPLTATVNQISTVANPNDTVTLPAATAGREAIVINSGANTLQIFPASGNDLGAGVDTSVTLAAGAETRFVSYNTTTWVQF